MRSFSIAGMCVAHLVLVGWVLNTPARAALITNPTQISGSQLWLDGNDADGDGVAEGAGEDFTPGGTATWVDKSAAGTNNATQATANLHPAVIASGLNSKGVVRFDGGSDSAGDYLNLPDFASGFTQATGFIVFTANGGSVDPGKARNGGAWKFGGSNDHIHFGGNGNNQLYDDFGVNSRHLVENAISSGTSTPYLYSVSVTGTTFTPWVDGVVGDGATYPSADTPAWTTTPTIGQNDIYRFNGDIAEVIIYDRVLSDGIANPYDNEYNDVMFYLQERWNLGLGLSATVQPLPAPEPSSLLLISLGLGVVTLRRRRRRS